MLPDFVATLLGHLCLAIAAHGKPRALRTDNAPVFHSEVFCRALRWMGIRQQFTKPGCPWMNGRIERLFGTLKKMLKSLAFRDEQALGTFRKILQIYAMWIHKIRDKIKPKKNYRRIIRDGYCTVA
jgi:transposase InsO family protein